MKNLSENIEDRKEPITKEKMEETINDLIANNENKINQAREYQIKFYQKSDDIFNSIITTKEYQELREELKESDIELDEEIEETLNFNLTKSLFDEIKILELKDRLRDETVERKRNLLNQIGDYYEEWHVEDPKDQGNTIKHELLIAEKIHEYLNIIPVMKEGEKEPTLYMYNEYENQWQNINSELKFLSTVKDVIKIATKLTEVPTTKRLINTIREFTLNDPVKPANQYYILEDYYLDTKQCKLIPDEEIGNIIFTERSITTSDDKLLRYNKNFTKEYFESLITEDFELDESVGITIKTLWNNLVDKPNKDAFNFWRIIGFIIEAMKYTNTTKKIPILYSKKTNTGKSFITKIIRDVVLKDRSTNIVPENLRDNHKHRLYEENDLLLLDELTDECLNDPNMIATFKRDTGTDEISERIMYTDDIVTVIIPLTMISTNVIPALKETSENNAVVYERFEVIELRNRFIQPAQYEKLSDDMKLYMYPAEDREKLIETIKEDITGQTQLWSLIINEYLREDYDVCEKYCKTQTEDDVKAYVSTNLTDEDIIRACYKKGNCNNTEYITNKQVLNDIKIYCNRKNINPIPKDLTKSGFIGMMVKQVFDPKGEDPNFKRVDPYTSYNIIPKRIIRTDIFVTIDKEYIESENNQVIKQVDNYRNKNNTDIKAQIFREIDESINGGFMIGELYDKFKGINIEPELNQLELNNLIEFKEGTE